MLLVLDNLLENNDDLASYTNEEYDKVYDISSDIYNLAATKNELTVIANEYENGVKLTFAQYNLEADSKTAKFEFCNSDYGEQNKACNDEININNIKNDYFIDTYTYKNSNVITILSNITGEELRLELMKNFTLEDPIYATVSPIGTNMDIINDNKAILTITFGDLISDYNVNSDNFEMKVEINSDTVIKGKVFIEPTINDLKDFSLDIIKIRLDKTTINDEIPKATYFNSSNGN